MPDQDAAAAARELDPNAQLDLLDRELTRRRAQREADAKRAAAAGGPCRYCGCTTSFKRPGVGHWHHDGAGPVCVPCWDALGPAGSDHEARVRAARLVLGQTPAPAWAGHGTTPAAIWWHDGYLGAALRWWHETPGARPGQGPERFGYVTAAQLLDRLYRDSTPRPPVLHSRGKRHRCPGCQARGEVWTVEQVGVSAPVASDGSVRSNRAYFRLTWRCVRCRHEDVEQRPEQLPGVPVSGLQGG